VRDYDKNPIAIRNNYLLKREFVGLTIYMCIFLFFAYRMYFHGIPNAIIENDVIDLRKYRDGLITTTIGTIIGLFMVGKIVRHFLKNKLFIKIYDTYITYDYLTEKGEFKIFTLQKQDILSIKWGFFPYSRLGDEIWVTETEGGKLDICFSLVLHFLIYIIYQFIYTVINFKIETYVLIRFKDGIMAIPKKEYPSNENIKFEWNSVFNSIPLGGHYFGK
jgi:hypothetical protein